VPERESHSLLCHNIYADFVLWKKRVCLYVCVLRERVSARDGHSSCCHNAYGIVVVCVLQCVAVCCSVLQCVAVSHNTYGGVVMWKKRERLCMYVCMHVCMHE